MAFDPTLPPDSEAVNNGANRIREFKTQMDSCFDFEGSFDETNVTYAYRGTKDVTGNRPAAGTRGFFFDTTRNQMQRDNGASWDDVGTMVPSGTVECFYQASPPTGWATVATINDKFLRIVTSAGTGGSTGGSGNTPGTGVSLAHSHTVNSHTHTLSSHTHTVDGSAYTGSLTASGAGNSAKSTTIVGDASSLNVAGGAGSVPQLTPTSSVSGTATSAGPSTNTSGATSPGTDSQLTTLAFQYADIVFGSKS